MKSMRMMLALGAAACILSACATTPSRLLSEPATLRPVSNQTAELRGLPAPERPLYVAVYALQDQTGQHKPNDNFADYSFAVTQGGANILMDVLRETGGGKWFKVLERNRLGDLFQERQIIRANRQQMAGPDGKPLPDLGPLNNAGVIFEGAITGYDSNVLTGGLGANFLGIGGDTQYRKDDVTVSLRAVSVLTGEVVVSTEAHKTIYSVALNGGANRYVGFNKLLQIEAGITTNEPVTFAVEQAIEKAVYALIMEGAERQVWSFANATSQQSLLEQYSAARDGQFPLPAAALTPSGGHVQASAGSHPRGNS